MGNRGLLIAAIASAWVLAPASVEAAEAWAMAKLEAGEVVAFEVHAGMAGQGQEPARGGGARMQILVRAPARDVWSVIVSCEQARRFIAGLQLCEVLEQQDNRALVRQVVDRGWLMPRFDFVFESQRRPYEWIGVKLVAGNLDYLRGSWRFEQLPEGTLVEHELFLRPGVPVPRFLVRRNLERTMPDMLACVRALADGSGSDELRRSDLSRCQAPSPAPP